MATFDVDLKGHYFLVGELTPLMAERGQGAIVNVSTMAAVFGVPGTGIHGAAKAGFNSLTKVWAAEFSPRGPGERRSPRDDAHAGHAVHGRGA